MNMNHTPISSPPTAASAARFPHLIPEPQIVRLRRGAVERPAGISLEADEDVRSLGRQLLTTFGEGDYRVTVRLDAEFAPSQAPQAAWPEAYALEINPREARLTARTLQGARWGIKTLGAILAAVPPHSTIPAATVVDWPTLSTRGIFVENKWGPDLMTLDDWRAVIDYLAERKMNTMGIGLYGCWCVQYDGRITEWIMTPVPDHPQLRREWTIRWYSPTNEQWQELTYLPRIFEEDFLGEIVAYGREQGVTVVPFVNSLGHNTLIPRLLPEISARDAQGNPRGTGYCLSEPKTREFVTGWYEHIFKKYFQPHGVEIFHIQMDEVWEDFCQCPRCSKHPREKMLQEWVITLARHLVNCGVKDVVLYNDQFTRHMDALDETFIQRLREEGLYEHVIVDWWWYDNDRIDPKVHPRIGRGLRAWVKPMTCYFNWARYNPYVHNIALMLEMAHAEGAEGAVSYSVFDAAWGREFDILAEYAWNFRGAGPVHRFEEKWAQVRADDEVLEAVRWLDRAAATAGYGVLNYYTYTYPRPNKPYPRHYPQEPLEQLTGRREALEFIAHAGARARDLLADRSGELARNLLAEAARIEAYGVYFASLLQVKEAVDKLARGPSAAATAPGGLVLAELVERARAAVVEAMRIIEANKPHYMVPSYLRDLSVLYEFVLQLGEDIRQAQEGRRDWAQVRWFVEIPVAQRGINTAT